MWMFSLKDMAVNSSSNDSLHPDVSLDCFITRPSSFVITTYYITNIMILLPLCILVLYLGLQRWRLQRSTSAAAMSHSDSFTYHMVVIELIGVLGCALCCSSIYRDHVNLFHVGYFLWCLPWYGEMFLHVLTCVDRYLAAVHPITYLSLRRERGIRIRNISIGGVWLLCFGMTSLAMAFDLEFTIVDLGLLIFSLIIIAFCSLSVLCVLIRPGPGEQGGNRERVGQSKQRAFYTIVISLGLLLLRTFTSLVWALCHMFLESGGCAMLMVEVWVSLPCSLVLPLLFLHRTGTLACCKNNTK